MLKSLIQPSGFKISILITAAFAFLFFWNYLNVGQGNFMGLLDKKIVDFVQNSRGNTLGETEIAIADIDTKSVDYYGRWPWGRDIMTSLLHELQTHYEIKVLGYDVTFAEPDPNDVTAEKVLNKFHQRIKRINQDKDLQKKIDRIRYNISSEVRNDARFAAELSKWDNIVQGYFMFASDDRIQHLSQKEVDDAASLIENSEITIIQGSIESLDFIPVYESVAVEPNIALLTAPNALSGYFNAFPDAEDGTVRRVHLVMRYQDRFFPSLDLQILRAYYGHHPIKMNVNEGGIDSIELGEKVLKTDSDGSIMVNYKGPGFTFPHFSVYDIINHKIPKDQLKNKVVLLGASEVGVFDLRTTPVGVDFPGVEVHTNLLDNILKDEYYFRSDLVHFITFILIIVIGLVFGIVLPKLSALPGLLFTFTFLGIYTAINLWSLEENKQWASFIYIIGVIVINWFAIIMYRYFSEEKDKRFIKGAFQQYLSPEVINRLVNNPDLLKLGGEKKELTAFFSDIQGFSTVSEALTPEELVELLNEYLTAMTDIIMKYGGTVDKFEGDAVIAFFGAPISYPDHALRACQASLEMQEKMVEMRKNWREQGRHELYIRIGLNTGDMVVGNMGSAYRMDYTMMGDSVNLAARLESVNKQYKTFSMISEFTYQKVREEVEVRELDMIRVVGKNEPVRIYELLGEKGKVSSENLKAFQYFDKALGLYRKQNWPESRKYFAHCNRLLINDGASQIFFERCKQFQSSPPNLDWDGVFQMTNK
ncbi:MAG: adenylate/guanylate cyclase domain-containing protein [Proteobacteria bacterium]|nr:adenylate/guanylate cyclase domain-containing protein [Pseudomonadota bacterium]